MGNSKGFLCICSDFKGIDFIKTIVGLGHQVYLVTSEAKRDRAWPYDLIAETFYMPEEDGRKWDLSQVRSGTAHLMRSTKIDRIIALDDYDVRKAAYLREEFRMPGMGQTTARHFYDKLAMRMQARDAGIKVPGFAPLLNDNDINDFLANSQGPWFVKPRSDAGTLGIRKVESAEAYWELDQSLGDTRYQYLIEEFISGDVCHVDTVTYNGDILFTRASRYLNPPFEIAHGGGIFQSCTLSQSDPLHEALEDLNRLVLMAFGMQHGASHSEFIVHDGTPYFLETSARVGGAHLADMVEAASGLNLWSEWAKIEHALLTSDHYDAPVVKHDFAGIIASLSRFESVDYSRFQDEHIHWTMDRPYHIGFIFRAGDQQSVLDKLDEYSRLIHGEFLATVPLEE